MSLASRHFLLDVNALIALGDPDHEDHGAVQRWFQAGGGEDWGVCPLTEAGFVRITTHPSYPRAVSMAQARAVLAGFAAHEGYRYWAISASWAALTARFSARLFGHQQVTDAYLLGLAVKEQGVLVTFDKGVGYLAGAEFAGHLLVLE